MQEETKLDTLLRCVLCSYLTDLGELQRIAKFLSCIAWQIARKLLVGVVTYKRGPLCTIASEAQDGFSGDLVPITLTKSAAHCGIRRRTRNGSFHTI